MGGNALKHLHPSRLTSNEVSLLFNHLSRNWHHISRDPPYLVPWVASKGTHGDVDIVCQGDPEKDRQDIALLAGCRVEQMVRNDRVLSVPMVLPWDPSRIAQVDFIFCQTNDARATRFFYSGGDFGMMLGRVAAWHGLVFGMDGLRLRANPEFPWSRDILLTENPGEILRVLGYNPVLPFFDTYETMWRFILSSPMARPWMMVPGATNAENRSRDRQRKTVGAFQDWLAVNYAAEIALPECDFNFYPRVPFILAVEWVRENFPGLDISREIQIQFNRYEAERTAIKELGIDRVLAVLDQEVSPERVGAIIHAMQPHLPSKHLRQELLGRPDTRAILLNQAESTAYLIARNMGLETRLPTPRPLG